MLVLLNGHEVIDLLRQLAAQHRAAARLHSILFVPRLAVHLAAQVRLNDADVHRLENGVADLNEVHLVARAALGRALQRGGVRQSSVCGVVNEPRCAP